jgi:hypothetical protein
VDFATHLVDRFEPMADGEKLKTGAEGFECSTDVQVVSFAGYSRRCPFSRQAHFQKVSEFPTIFFLYPGWAVKVTLIEKTTDRVQQGDDRVVLFSPN